VFHVKLVATVTCSHFIAVFIKIVKSVLIADKFQLSSPPAIATKQIAVDIIQWSKDVENMGHLAVFAKHLETELRSCCANVKSSTGKLRKEKLWGLFHQKRTSEAFNNNWIKFLKNSVEIKETQPEFYQDVTQELFTKINEGAFPVTPPTSSSTSKAEVYTM